MSNMKFSEIGKIDRNIELKWRKSIIIRKWVIFFNWLVSIIIDIDLKIY